MVSKAYQDLKEFNRYLKNPNNSWLKLTNYTMVEMQRRLSPTSFVIGYPSFLIVEPGNLCNLRCPLCPTGRGEEGRPKGMMSFDNFGRVVDELGRYVYKIQLYNWGEPLLNKHLFEIIAYAKDANIETEVSSNLTALNSAMALEMIESGLGKLIVSLGGASPETYQAYHVGGNFWAVIESVRQLVAKKQAKSATRPLIQLKFLLLKTNEHEVEKMAELAEHLRVDELLIECTATDLAKLPLERLDERVSRNLPYLPQGQQYAHFYKKSIETTRFACRDLWHLTVINWDGSISPCCYVWEEKYDFGNMFTEGGFRSVWNNELYRQSRNIVRGKPANVDTICRLCKDNEYNRDAEAQRRVTSWARRH